MTGSGERRTRRLATLALVSVAAIWGATFVLVKDALGDLPPLAFLALRFAVGTAALAVVWPGAVRGLRSLPRPALFSVGFALAAGYAFQTLGLAYTGATNAGFITALYVVFTPLVAAVVFRTAPSARALSGVGLATIGLVLLSLRLVDGRPVFGGGDLLVALCAVAFAVHIVALGVWAPRTDVRALTLGQVGLSALVFALAAPFDRGGSLTGRVWVAVGVTAIGATAFGFAAQTWAQTRLAPTRTAVVLTTEPVFAGLFGFALAGERLGLRGWIGAALILGAVAVVELRADAVGPSDDARIGSSPRRSPSQGADDAQGDLRDR